jgi:hypothetical protein
MLGCKDYRGNKRMIVLKFANKQYASYPAALWALPPPPPPPFLLMKIMMLTFE